MKLQVGVAVLAAAALAAGGALAQGTFSPSQPKSPWATPKAPSAPSYTPPKPKTYGAPEPAKPKTFEPYKPYQAPKPKSVYGPGGATTHVPY